MYRKLPLIIILNLLIVPLAAHDPASSRFKISHQKPIEHLTSGEINLNFSIAESITKSPVSPKNLKYNKFSQTFIIGQRSSFFQIAPVDYNKNTWQSRFKISNNGYYWLWLEGETDDHEPFMLPISLRVGGLQKVPADLMDHGPEQLQSQSLDKSAELISYQGEVLKISVKNSDKTPIPGDSEIWKKKWTVVVANWLGSKILHAELTLLPKLSQFQIHFPHGLKTMQTMRVWLYQAENPEHIFHFQWNPKP